MIDPNRCLYFSVFVIGLSFLTGCATVKHPSAVVVPEKQLSQAKGIQHKVNRGETLWRIARTYGVTVDEVIRANNIPDAASIEVGQLVFIPGAGALRNVPALSAEEGKDNDFIWPVQGKVFSYFRETQGGTHNRGIDIGCAQGDVIKASRSGKVVLASRLPGHGYTVILEHADGFFTVYSHNAQIMVAVNDQVSRGSKIALPASSGGKLYAHFEIRKGDKPSNPLYYLP